MPSISHHVRDDVNTKNDTFRRFEVITGERRRREWTIDEKLAIVAESFSTTTSISEVARRHRLNRNQLFQWRSQFRRGILGETAVGPFVPVTIAAPGASDGVPIPLPPPVVGAAPPDGVVEVLIGMATVRVPPSADEATVRRVLEAVRQLR